MEIAEGICVRFLTRVVHDVTIVIRASRRKTEASELKPRAAMLTVWSGLPTFASSPRLYHSGIACVMRGSLKRGYSSRSFSKL